MRVLYALTIATIVFVIGIMITDVHEMLDGSYCFEHADRPVDAEYHEEELSFLPPGPRCRYTTSNEDEVAVGPGLAPAVVAGISLLVAIVVLRWPRRGKNVH